MIKIALIASSGGHFFQLYSLKDFWAVKEHFWISFPTQDAKYLLKDEKVFWACYPTNRNLSSALDHKISYGSLEKDLLFVL